VRAQISAGTSIVDDEFFGITLFVLKLEVVPQMFRTIVDQHELFRLTKDLLLIGLFWLFAWGMRRRRSLDTRPPNSPRLTA
jgi:hypothetical protein